MRRWATTALVILTALNFVNYIDRSVLFAVQPLVQHEFPGSDAKFGLLTTAFFFCYMVTAPLVGWLADRHPRRLIMCVGALIWSAATLLTAVTHNFTELMIRHTLVGVGEATFVAIAPSFLSDLLSGVPARQGAGSLLHGDTRRYGDGISAGRRHGRTLGLARTVPGGRGAGCGAGLLLLLVPEPVRGAQDRLAVTLERGTFHGTLAQSGVLERDAGHGDDDLCGGRDAGLDADISLRAFGEFRWQRRICASG